MFHKFKNVIWIFFYIGIIFLIFHSWFLHNEIIGGDWPHFYQEAINNFSFFPSAWDGTHGNGLGGTIISYALDSYLYATGYIFSVILHIPWNIVYKLFWFGCFIIISSLAAARLIKTVFQEMPIQIQLLASLIYTTNTYILMLVGGGQMGVAIAYAFAPWVLSSFIRLFSQPNLKQACRTSVILSLQILFDPRITYITFLLLAFYIVFLCVFFPSTIKSFFHISIKKKLLCIFPFVISICLHAFWLIPSLFYKQPSLEGMGSIYTSIGAVQFFSFAKFEDAFSLLHPNWPENIFGKVGFLKPEFLILPIIAFSSLFFVNKQKIKTIGFFSILSLLGSFLAKGANPLWGFIYLWMFEHIPGFVFFRDPVKFYVIIAIAYSILIPYTIYAISKLKKIFSTLLIIFLIFWAFIIRYTFENKLTGTFSQREVPYEYQQLKSIISNNSEFYRTMWIPSQSRFAFVTPRHPSIEAAPLFQATNAAEMSTVFNRPTIQDDLINLSVKYIIVPADPYGEIFISDRKYDAKKRDEFISLLETIPWLKRENKFHSIALFEVPKFRDLLWLDAEGKVSYKIISQTRYDVTVNTTHSTVLYFGQYFDNGWVAIINGKKILPEQTKLHTQKYFIPAGNYTLQLSFQPEKYYQIGRIISILTIVIIGMLFVLQSKNK